VSSAPAFDSILYAIESGALVIGDGDGDKPATGNLMAPPAQPDPLGWAKRPGGDEKPVPSPEERMQGLVREAPFGTW